MAGAAGEILRHKKNANLPQEGRGSELMNSWRPGDRA